MVSTLVETDCADVSGRTAYSPQPSTLKDGDRVRRRPRRFTYKGEGFYLPDEEQLNALLAQSQFGEWAKSAALTYNITPSVALLGLAVALQKGRPR
jgi:hypothetical protein